MHLQEINRALKKLRIKTPAIEFLEYDHYSYNTEYYKLSNGKSLVVVWDFDVIKSIIRQKDRTKKYSFLLGGQANKNSECIYYARHDYENNAYDDILSDNFCC